MAVTQNPPPTLWPVNGIAPDGDDDGDFDDDGCDERIICGDHIHSLKNERKLRCYFSGWLC